MYSNIGLAEVFHMFFVFSKDDSNDMHQTHSNTISILALSENLETHFTSEILNRCHQAAPHRSRQAKSKGIAALVSQVVDDLVIDLL